MSVDVDNNINRLIRIHDMTDAASGCNPGLIPRLLGYVLLISIISRGNSKHTLSRIHIWLKTLIFYIKGVLVKEKIVNLVPGVALFCH